MERPAARFLIHRIIKLIKNGDWTIIYKKMDDTDGYVLHDELTIIIDPRQDVLTILVHECLHILFENGLIQGEKEKEEQIVSDLEILCMERMTPKQAIILTKLLADYLVLR